MVAVSLKKIKKDKNDRLKNKSEKQNLYQFSFFFFSSRRRHTRSDRDWSSDVCSSDLMNNGRKPGTYEDIPNISSKYGKIEAETIKKYETLRNSNMDIEQISNQDRKSVV